MKYYFHNHFRKSYLKLPTKLQDVVDSRILLLLKDPKSSILNNHVLLGKYKNYRSINITGDYRAIYKVVSTKEVIFVKIGTHSELYG